MKKPFFYNILYLIYLKEKLTFIYGVQATQIHAIFEIIKRIILKIPCLDFA